MSDHETPDQVFIVSYGADREFVTGVVRPSRLIAGGIEVVGWGHIPATSVSVIRLLKHMPCTGMSTAAQCGAADGQFAKDVDSATCPKCADILRLRREEALDRQSRESQRKGVAR